MNSRTAERPITAPLMDVAVRLATKYIPHAPGAVRVAVYGLGGRLFARLAAAQRMARRAP